MMRPTSTRPAIFAQPATLALLAVLLLLAPGCAVARYAGNRIMDLTDIIDFKYGVAIGAGAKVEITQFVGAGGGAAALGYSREWYGRRSMERKGFAFVHLGGIGVDGGYGSMNLGGWSDERAEIYLLLVNGSALADFGIAPGGDAIIDTFNSQAPIRLGTEISEIEPPTRFEPLHPLDYWRFGVEAIVPIGVHFGIYFNFGQLIDFVVGLTTYDPTGDDGLSFFDTYNIPPEEAEDESVR